ncbi:MLP-like protein 423 [Linum perenne]
MAQLVKIEVEVAMKNPNKLMDFLKNNLHTLPQLFPESYKSVQILHGGSGRTSSQLTTGAIISLTYSLPGDSSSSSASSLRGEVEVEAMDEARKSITLNVVGGDGLKTYKSFRSKCELVGNTVKYSIEYEKASPASPPADPYLDFYVKLSKALDI